MRRADMMQAAQSGLDVLIGVFAAVTWAFAAFVLGHRFLSPVAGGLLAVAVLSSGVIAELRAQLYERRISALLRGACPSCGTGILPEHRHRRWEPERNEWVT